MYTNPKHIGGGICVHELEKLIKEIEKLRLYMIQIKEGKSFTDPEVVAASQQLDAALNKYQEMVM